VPECRGYDFEPVHLHVAATHRVARKELDLTDGGDPNEANCSQTCDAGIVEYCPPARGCFQTQVPYLVVRTQLQAIDTLDE
jgi:hypothetical protein